MPDTRVGSITFGPDPERAAHTLTKPRLVPVPEGLEAAAIAANLGAVSDTALVSIAISLRRLADVLEVPLHTAAEELRK